MKGFPWLFAIGHDRNHTSVSILALESRPIRVQFPRSLLWTQASPWSDVPGAGTVAVSLSWKASPALQSQACFVSMCASLLR